MIIESSDGRRSVDVGKDEIWHSLYSTVLVRLEEYLPNVPDGLRFLETAECKAVEAENTARQINLIRDRLSLIPPQNAVYDYRHPEIEAPWATHLSSVITSCANLYTSAEGQDLLFEIVSLLCYASIKKVDVCKM